MKLIISFLFIAGANFLFAQNDATTTLSTMLLDREISLDQKDKKTYSNLTKIDVPAEFWNQFERVDAVFISGWSGSGALGKAQYLKDIAKMDPNFSANPLLYFAEKSPGFFTYPRQQSGFGTEIVIIEGQADSLCLNRYKKAKIAPKGIYACVIDRFVSTTPVNFFYRYALPKKYYAGDQIPSLSLMLRCSSKKDTVKLDTKIAITVMGKRKELVREFAMHDFLKTAVLNGLRADAMPMNHARWILENPKVFFVKKCQICSAVQAAFEEYIKTYQALATKIDQKQLDAIVLGKEEEKQIALSRIINTYTEKHIELLNLSPKEKSKLQSNLEDARKSGMKLKPESFGNFCPSCDGACGIKK